MKIKRVNKKLNTQKCRTNKDPSSSGGHIGWKISDTGFIMKTGPRALHLITGAFRPDSIQPMVFAAHIYRSVDVDRWRRTDPIVGSKPPHQPAFRINSIKIMINAADVDGAILTNGRRK